MEKENNVILVTGGCGHIGSYIVEHYSRELKNSKIVVVDNLYNGNLENLRIASQFAHGNDNELLFCQFDICDNDSLNLCFEQYKPKHVFHQASLLTLDTKKDRRRGLNVNVGGFINIMEMCLEHNVEKLVYASSASVFGDPDDLPTDENHHFENCSLLYGASKICDEYLAKSYSREEGLKFVGLRYFNVYGSRQPLNNVYTQIVPKWINSFIEGKPITIYGDGKQTMDMIHGKDVAMMNVLAMEKDIYEGKKIKRASSYEIGSSENIKYYKEPFGGFINIGTGFETSVKKLFGLIKKELEKQGVDTSKSKVFYDKHDPNLVKRRKCDASLMHELLAYHQIDVTEGISMTIEELLQGQKKDDK